MKNTRTRYFDMPDAHCTLQLNVDIGSEADKATETDFTSAYDTVMREVDRCEYDRLSKLYMGDE